MTREEFLQRIGAINTWRRGGQRAPHKPLLLLFALGRIRNGRKRFLTYEEIEPHLEELLRKFGTPRKVLHPEAPFSHLCTDGLWEVQEAEKLPRTTSGAFHVKALRQQKAQGGLPDAVHELLLARPLLALEAAQQILENHFPLSLHEEIRNAVGIPSTWEVRDQPQRTRAYGFRRDVLREYQRRCAVCNYDVRLGDELMGLEAAHIKWHSHGGPDDVSNGLALCGLHHKALDRGALGLELDESGIRVVISSDVTGLSAPVQWILGFHRQPLRKPPNTQLAPKGDYVRWHQREVFRKPPLA